MAAAPLGGADEMDATGSDMTTLERVQEVIVATLVRRHGGNRQQWRRALGPIRVYDAATHPHCNWSAEPQGASATRDAVEDVLDTVRMAHPIVVPDR